MKNSGYNKIVKRKRGKKSNIVRKNGEKKKMGKSNLKYYKMASATSIIFLILIIVILLIIGFGIWYIFYRKAPIIPPNMVDYKLQGNQILFEWNRVENATGYKLYRGKQKGKYDDVSETTNTKIGIGNLEYCNKYYFAISSIYENGLESVKSKEYEIDILPPSTRVIDAVKRDNDLTVKLEPVLGISGYILKIGNDPNNLELERRNDTPLITVNVSQYGACTPLYISAATYTKGNCISKFSDTFSFTPPNPPSTNISDIRYASGGLFVSWNKVTSNLPVSYTLEIKQDKEFIQVEPPTTRLQNTNPINIPPNTPLQLRVKTISQNGCISYSPIVNYPPRL